MSHSLNLEVADSEKILTSAYKNNIATLTMNRPDQYNCLSEEMLDLLEDELLKIANDNSIHVVILGGTGPAFCAGHDLKQMRANPSKKYYQELFKRCSQFMMTITQIPQPVIAKVQGVAAAAGCQLVATCDLAVASETATFATTGVNLALFCSTPSVAVSRNLSRKRAAELLFTGEMMSARDAREFGLINKFVSENALDDETVKLATKIAQKPKVAIATGKKMLYRQLEMDLESAYSYAANIMACNMMEKDTVEGIDAFIEKRPPNW